MKKIVFTVGVALLAFLLALGITLYPIISTRYNERHQSEIRTAYAEQLEQADTSAVEEAWALAKAYNASLRPGIQLPDAFSREAILSASENYADLLDVTGSGIMGYVQIPTIQVNLPIYHGTDDATLEIGVGHLLGSSLPVGGKSTHTVLTGHSGMASKKMFSDLDQLQVGDVFYLEVLGETLAYQVDQIQTVLPYDTTYLCITDGEDYCTLVTCTPFGVNTHRLLVRGSRIPYEEGAEPPEEVLEDDTKPQSTWEREYLRSVYVSLGGVTLAGFITLAGWIIRRERHEDGA